MPIYEYRCLECHNEFERMQKFSDPVVDTCPSCAGTVQKLISRSTFHLKGDGWYVTDYARKSSSNGSDSDRTSTSDSASTSDSTSTSDTTSESSTAQADTKKSTSSSDTSKPASADAATS